MCIRDRVYVERYRLFHPYRPVYVAPVIVASPGTTVVVAGGASTVVVEPEPAVIIEPQPVVVIQPQPTVVVVPIHRQWYRPEPTLVIASAPAVYRSAPMVVAAPVPVYSAMYT